MAHLPRNARPWPVPGEQVHVLGHFEGVPRRERNLAALDREPVVDAASHPTRVAVADDGTRQPFRARVHDEACTHNL